MASEASKSQAQNRMTVVDLTRSQFTPSSSSSINDTALETLTEDQWTPISHPSAADEPKTNLSRDQFVALSDRIRRLELLVAEPASLTRDPTSQISAFTTERIGFFDPNNNKNPPISTHYTDRGPSTTYHNVFTFTDNLRARLPSPAAIDASFLGEANTWYVTELSASTRRSLQNDSSLHAWISALEARFKLPSGVAWSRLKNTHFTADDVRRGKNPVHYAHEVFLLARAVGRVSGHSSEAREEFDVREAFEVQVAYDQIDAELKRSGWADLPPPDSNATREEFLRQIMIVKNTWYELYPKPGGR
ncbi:hypothetical protein MMC10_008943 [Thelotrema lepadinum]|nr:hypothetical protein [Thelotrema lepadinum]